MSTVFTKIINGDIPSYKIAEDKDHYAFLDISPLVKGHTLVIPKVEIDYIFDLSDDQLSALHNFAKKVAKGIEIACPCKRVGVLVLGTAVPHAHIHLTPLTNEIQMSINSDRLRLKHEEMQEVAASIAKNIKL